MRRVAWLGLGLCFLLGGCASLRERVPFVGKKKEVRHSGVYKENLDPDRVVDLALVKKLTGEKFLGIFSKSKIFLEGYIRGIVVDYDDNPIDGVIVRVLDKGKDLSGYDPGISDENGVYRIRFSLPVEKKKVDASGFVSYNSPWEQQLQLLGAALEPQTKQTKFRLYFDQETGFLGIGEDVPKTIIRKVTEFGPSKVMPKFEKNPDKKKAEGATPATPEPKRPPKKESQDFLGNFGDFNP